ncbi:hypothetical protein PMAYCL1PPCAC_08548, partial [Pristionchus mayeri]
ANLLVDIVGVHKGMLTVLGKRHEEDGEITKFVMTAQLPKYITTQMTMKIGKVASLLSKSSLERFFKILVNQAITNQSSEKSSKSLELLDRADMEACLRRRIDWTSGLML